MAPGKQTDAATLRALAAGRGKAPKAGEHAPGTVRLGVYVPAALRKRVRIAAAERGQTVSALVVAAIERELARGA
jgi:hypothetical protein